MKKISIAIILIIIIIVVWILLDLKENIAPIEQPIVQQQIKNMRVTSPAFNHQENIPSKYTCDAEDINPPFVFSDVPAEAKSLALIHDDPEATAGTWVHWTMWNIAPDTREIKENIVPVGAVQGITSFGDYKYGGPCPPSGTHHYRFKVYALDTMLDLPASADAQTLEASMQGHILARAELVGLYKRK